MSWAPVFNATGPRGPGLLSGSGAPSSATGAVNDFYLDLSTANGPYLYGPKTSSGWPTSNFGLQGVAGSLFLFGTTQPGPPSFAGLRNNDFYLRTDTSILYQFQVPASGGAGLVQVGSFQGAQGAPGLSVMSASGPPSSSTGVVGQPAYLDTASGLLYGAKTSSGWPSSSISLVGASGLSVLTGSGPPSSSLGAQSQPYIDTTNAALYVKGASSWSSGVSLVGTPGQKGDQGLVGPSGLSVLSGSGSPASSLGVVGQPAYLDTSAGALYGAKTSSGWPSSSFSLVGQQGPPAPGVLTGSGAPSSTNPGGTITPGSFYIRTDTTPYQLYGPYTSANGWPSSYSAMGGGTFQVTSGPPASSLGSVGDCAFDLTNALFYPPKTASGWTAAPINMVGPTGAPGPIRSYTKGYVWLSSSNYGTANAATPVVEPLTQSGSYATIQLVEPMISSGQIIGVTGYCVGSTTNCNASINVLKNGAALCSFSNVVACQSTATATTGYAKAANVYTFSAGDALSMTAAFSASGGQELYITLHYLLNS